MAQYISRIGLIIDGNTGESLEQAKNVNKNFCFLIDTLWEIYNIN